MRSKFPCIVWNSGECSPFNTVKHAVAVLHEYATSIPSGIPFQLGVCDPSLNLIEYAKDEDELHILMNTELEE